MPPVKYRRTRGRPLTVTRAEPDPRLEASGRYERIDGEGQADTATPSTPATPAQRKESDS